MAPKGDTQPKKTEVVKPPALPPTGNDVMCKNVTFVDKFVDTRDRSLLLRVLRYTGYACRHATVAQVKALVETYVDSARKGKLLALLERADAARAARSSAAAQDVSMDAAASSAGKPAAAPAGSAAPAPVKLPKAGGPAALEIDAYLHTLVISLAAQAPELLSAAGEAARELLSALAPHNRRTLDFFQARAWATVALAAEGAGGGEGLSALVPFLLAAHRTATLRHDEYGQAVALTTLLRAHVVGRDYEAASALLSKAVFPEAASSAQLVRYLYYTGRVRAVTMQYAEAHTALLQASRTAPPAALHFRATVTKFDLLVRLLMGEIPERSFFAPPEPALRAALLPYLALTRSVRGGDLKDFFAVVAAHTGVFERDGTATLVRRLAASVVKAGLRRVSAAYSRISFADIATRLSLPSAADAEFLCAKAVADGIIDGSLDHAAGVLTSSSTPNVYTTPEPAEAFAKRIAFCLDVHNEAVRAMKYPPRPANAALESSEKAREREREDEQLLEELGEEGDEDEGMD